MIARFLSRKLGTVMDDTLVILYCLGPRAGGDEFCKEFYPEWEKTLIAQGKIKRRRPSKFSPAEIMSIIIFFHMLHFRDFKTYTFH